jgi:hypothetical protein
MAPNASPSPKSCTLQPLPLPLIQLQTSLSGHALQYEISHQDATKNTQGLRERAHTSPNSLRKWVIRPGICRHGVITLGTDARMPHPSSKSMSRNGSARTSLAGITLRRLGKSFTDWHLDFRYDIGAEADCGQYLCCRPYSTNTKLDTTVANASVPASRWGYLYCDTSADLRISTFADMPNFINLSDVTFAIFTGNIVSHDNDDQLSQAPYVELEYEEKVTYETFKAGLGTIVYSFYSYADCSKSMQPSETIPCLKQRIPQTVFETMAKRMPSHGITTCSRALGRKMDGPTEQLRIVLPLITVHMPILRLRGSKLSAKY